MSLDVLVAISPDMARELAESQQVCVRPILRRVEDRQTGLGDLVAIPCGSTREAVCSPCAAEGKADTDAAVRRRVAPHRRTQRACG